MRTPSTPPLFSEPLLLYTQVDPVVALVAFVFRIFHKDLFLSGRTL